MEWIVKIDNKPKFRILVKYKPLDDLLVFYGQYKINNLDWIDFSVYEVNKNVDLDTIQSTMIKVYNQLEERVTVYENLSEGFSYIKRIEVMKD